MENKIEEPAVAYPNFHSLEDFLGFAETSLEKWEMREGNIYAMSHTTKAHSEITDNIQAFFKRKMKPRGCKSFQESIYLQIASKNSLYLPDVAVTCNPDDISHSNRFIKSPSIIVEVLSDSTELNDRTSKWHHYRQLSSLRYYLLVSQHEQLVEVFGRPNAQSLFFYQAYSGPDAIIDLGYMNLEIEMAVIYEDLVLPNVAEPESDR